MTYAQAQHIAKRYVCAHCYGHLTIFDGESGFDVRCQNCDNFDGKVTKSWAERRKSESIGEAIEVNQLLQSLGILPTPAKKSQTQLMDELGF